MNPIDQAAFDAGYRFDEARAVKVRDFFKRFLRHSKGEWAGKPFELLDWQWNDVIKPLFGWYNPADNTRRYTHAFIGIPKKNGKSTLAAAIALYLLFADNEPGAEVYSAAVDRDQASIVFNEASSMVKYSPALYKRCTVLPSRKVIKYKNSTYRALSADVQKQEGLNISGLIFDELHAQRDRKLWDALQYGGASRRQPLFVSITTAGYDRESVCYEQWQYADAVLAGRTTDHNFFGYIAAATADDDWNSEAVWRKANPSYGITISAKSFIADHRRASLSAANENAFKRYRLNVWTQNEVRWLSMEDWDKCPARKLGLSRLRGKKCYGGLDLSSTQDIAALVLYFPEYKYLLPYFWVPRGAVAKRERSNGDRYNKWCGDKYISVHPGRVLDYAKIRAKLQKLAGMFDLEEVAIDRWNSSYLASQLLADGIDLVDFGQGFASMSAPCKELEKLIVSHALNHGANPVLRWMAGNAAVVTDDAANYKLTKKASTEKIDGIVASVMALGRSMIATDSFASDDGGLKTL